MYFCKFDEILKTEDLERIPMRQSVKWLREADLKLLCIEFNRDIHQVKVLNIIRLNY